MFFLELLYSSDCPMYYPEFIFFGQIVYRRTPVKFFSEGRVKYIKTVKYFLNLDFFIIENVTAKDETQDIISLEVIKYLGQNLSCKEC